MINACYRQVRNLPTGDQRVLATVEVVSCPAVVVFLRRYDETWPQRSGWL